MSQSAVSVEQNFLKTGDETSPDHVFRIITIKFVLWNFEILSIFYFILQKINLYNINCYFNSTRAESKFDK